MLSLVTAMLGLFFFVVLFVQNMLRYTPIEAGLAFLPISVAIVTDGGLWQRFLPALGPKPFMLVGPAFVTLGLGRQTFISPDSTYLGGGAGPDAGVRLRHGSGLRAPHPDRSLRSRPARGGRGVRSARITQQVGGSLGLSILTTVFGTASREEAEKQVRDFMAKGTAAEFARTRQLPAPWSHKALACWGWPRPRPYRRWDISAVFVLAVAMAVLALATAALVIRVPAPEADPAPVVGYEPRATGPRSEKRR